MDNIFGLVDLIAELDLNGFMKQVCNIILYFSLLDFDGRTSAMEGRVEVNIIK